jgi:PAS domain S-box-containing protein
MAFKIPYDLADVFFEHSCLSYCLGPALKASIAKKGLYLLLVPCTLQVLFLIGLVILQAESELAPLRAQQEREVAMALTRFIQADWTLLHRIDHCLRNRIRPDASCREADAQLALAADPLKQMYLGLAEKRSAILGVAYFQTDLAQMKRTYAMGALCVDALSQSSRTALANASDCFESPGSPGPEPVLAKAKQSWQVATEGLRDFARVSQAPSAAPGAPNQLRRKWLTVLLGWSVFNLLSMFASTFLFLRSIRSRLIVVLDNNMRYSLDQELNDPVGGTDEIALLDASFHQMAAELAAKRYEQTAIIENAQDLICSTSAEGKITAANRAAESLLGLRAKELVGTWLIDTIVLNDQRIAADKLIAVASGKDQLPFETRVVSQRGAAVDCLCSAVWSEEDKTAFWVFHDIRHKKMADRLQREVVEVACHELKEPILFISEFHDALAASAFGQFKRDPKIASAIRAPNACLLW